MTRMLYRKVLHGLVGYAWTTLDPVPHQKLSCIECEGNVAGGRDSATVLPRMFHCDCVHNTLEGSVKVFE